MENKFNFLTPNILDITYEDFCKLVEVEMQKVEKEYSQTPIRDREKYLQIWVNINIDLIPDNYLTCLYKKITENKASIFICSIEKIWTSGKYQNIEMLEDGVYYIDELLSSLNVIFYSFNGFY